MPIKRGRKAETLAAAAAPTPASEEDENAAWEARIAAEAGGGDPLDVWIKYIRWWQDRCVAGGPVQQLLPVLERCAFAFKEDPRVIPLLDALEKARDGLASADVFTQEEWRAEEQTALKALKKMNRVIVKEEGKKKKKAKKG